MLVNPLKLEMFKRALKGDKLSLTEYGEIIESGYGKNPTADDIGCVRQKGFTVDENPEDPG